MNSVKSPFSNNLATPILQFNKDRISRAYMRQFGVDIRSFLNTNDESITLYLCPESGLRFFSPASLAGDSHFYDKLSKAFETYYEVEKWEHDYALSLIEKEAKGRSNLSLLEIGCAEGAYLKKVKERFPSITLTGIDINNVAIEKARAAGIDAITTTIEDLSKNNAMKFDIVCTFQVLEHIANVKSYFDSISDIINPGGILIVAVPNSDSFILKTDKEHTLNLPPHHMGWWNEESLHSISKLFPFMVEEIVKEPTDYKNTGTYYESWLKGAIGPIPTTFVYPLTRWFVKPVFSFFLKPNEGMSILAMYRNR